VALTALALAGCGGSHRAARSTRTPAPAAPARSVLPAADRQLCPLIYARLQRVTLALSSSSELIAQSENPRDLTRRITTEQQQLERSARLMAAGAVPAALRAPNGRMVRALRAFARDFGRARAPAARGDFSAAVAAMTDKPVVGRIVAAASALQRACQP
jgi:hypothetical protein